MHLSISICTETDGGIVRLQFSFLKGGDTRQQAHTAHHPIDRPLHSKKAVRQNGWEGRDEGKGSRGLSGRSRRHEGSGVYSYTAGRNFVPRKRFAFAVPPRPFALYAVCRSWKEVLFFPYGTTQSTREERNKRHDASTRREDGVSGVGIAFRNRRGG